MKNQSAESHQTYKQFIYTVSLAKTETTELCHAHVTKSGNVDRASRVPNVAAYYEQMTVYACGVSPLHIKLQPVMGLGVPTDHIWSGGDADVMLSFLRTQVR